MNIFYTDGATKNNGMYGKQESYTCVTDAEGGILFNTPIGDRTNIEAEGFAIGECLRYIVDNNKAPAVIRTDSEFWVKVLKGEYTLKKAHLIPIKNRILELLKDKRITILWMSRDNNLAGIYLENQYEKKWPKPWETYGKKALIAACPHCQKPIFLQVGSTHPRASKKLAK